MQIAKEPLALDVVDVSEDAEAAAVTARLRC